MGLINTQITEYDRLITLANSLNQPELVEAVVEAKSRTCTTKRKYDDLLAGTSTDPAAYNAFNEEQDDFVNVEDCEASVSNAIAVAEHNDNESYEAAMNFVANYKQEKADRGERMDWIACLNEGKDILKYKNANSLRNQFYKYMRRKEKI